MGFCMGGHSIQLSKMMPFFQILSSRFKYTHKTLVLDRTNVRNGNVEMKKFSFYPIEHSHIYYRLKVTQF